MMLFFWHGEDEEDSVGGEDHLRWGYFSRLNF